LQKLGEIVDMGDEIDLPATVWSLTGNKGPGVCEVGKAARELSEDQRRKVREALEAAGADSAMLRDFDLEANPATGANEFVFDPRTRPHEERSARRIPRWVEMAVAA
jgi:hypothetical protein